MNAVCWNPEVLIVRRSDMQSRLSELILEVGKHHGLKVQMDPTHIQSAGGLVGSAAASRAQFREGCVKAIELGMQPLPGKARVMAEIHRRIDRLAEEEVAGAPKGDSLSSIVTFTGAWALAAQLMSEGLSVHVHEENVGSSWSQSEVGDPDVEVVIPAFGGFATV